MVGENLTLAQRRGDGTMQVWQDGEKFGIGIRKEFVSMFIYNTEAEAQAVIDAASNIK
jgi:hypothetical protein